MKRFLLLISISTLCACEQKALECNDPNLENLVKEIIWKSINEVLPNEENLLSEEIFKKNLSIQYGRPTAYDDVIKKYSCAGTINYYSLGIPEFGKSLEGEYSRYNALKNARREAVRSPLRYSALSVLTDNSILLDEVLENSNATGYSFETIYASQRVGGDNFGEIALSKANKLALYVVAALSVDNPYADIGQSTHNNKDSEQERGYTLTSKEKVIINRSLSNFNKTYKESGVTGVFGERDKCYQAAYGIKDPTLTLQCIAYDYISSSIISGMESSKSLPRTPGLAPTDIRIRAFDSIENTMSETLSTSNLRETFFKSIKQESDEQIARESILTD